MIYDMFMFNSERELLDIRLNELSGCDEVVIHILVEAAYTFSGKPKPLHFNQIKEQYKDWPIVSLIVEQFPETDNPWDREKYQRNILLKGLQMMNPKDDDVVIISDVDEIPRQSIINSYKSEMGFSALIQDKFCYYLNCMEGAQVWDRARIMPYSYLKDKTPDEVRNSGYPNKISNAGWHFSYLGGVDKIVEKFNSFSHQELNIDKYTNVERLKSNLETGQSLWSDELLKIVEVDGTFPEEIRNNISKYKHLIK